MRTIAAVLMTVLVSACSVDLPLRDDVTYTCDDNRDCPLELSCAVGIKQCVRDLDVTKPHLTSITATNRETVVLVFDEAVNAEQAKLPGIYFIVRDDGLPLEVRGASAQDDGTSVVLRTGPQRGGAVYTFTTHLGDAQGNNARVDQNTFVGFGPAPDRVVPDAIAPTAGSVIIVPPAEQTAPHVTLAWSPRTGTIEYTVDVSATADFTTIESTILIPGDEARHELPVAEGRTYFWRVRSDATPLEEYGRSVFTVLFDTIYVYCPQGTTCRAGDGLGSKNMPLASVSRAVNLANDRGLSTVAIASRGNDPTTGLLATYHEPVAITGNAITLRGGYERTFADTPNRAINHARIAYEGSVISAIQNRGALVIDKLEIEATIDPALSAATQNLQAFLVDTPGASVTISDSYIGTTDLPLDGPATSFPNQTTALTVFDGAAPVRIDAASTLLAGPSVSVSSTVIQINGELEIEGTELIARPTVETDAGSPALSVVAGDVSVRHARIRAAASQGGAITIIGGASAVIADNAMLIDGPGFCFGAGLTAAPGGELRFERNRVVITSGCTGAIGVYLGSPESVTVANNAFVINSTTISRGFQIVQDSLAQIVNNTVVISGAVATGFQLDDAHPDIVNNLIVIDAASNSAAIVETNATSDPKSVLSNVFVGADDAYRNEGDITSLATIDETNGETIDCSGSGTTHASGNVTLPAADPFVSLAGPDGNRDTLDFDLRLAAADPALAQAGVDTTRSVCGSNESPHGCGSVITDIAGLARTVPVSVGAHEKD